MAGGLRWGVRALGALGAALVGAAAGAGAAPAKEFVGQYVHSLPGPIANMRVADALLMIMCTMAALFGGGILFMVTNLLKDLNVQPALDKKRKEGVEFPLAEVVQLNHNTKLLRFRLGRHNQPLGLPTGQHLKILAEDADGEEVARRAYTPTSGQDVVGHFDLVIKVYPNGAMTQHMDKMKVGDKLKFRGPQGHFKYERNMKRSIGMVAGGTGITPMVSARAAAPRDAGSGGPALTPPQYQVAKAILEDPEDATKLSLIFANVTEEDILIRDLLEALAERHPKRFKVYYVLNEPPKGWKGGSGFVTAAMMKEHFEPPGDDVLLLRCGPPPMNKAMKAAKAGLGYSDAMQFEF